jgi:hypothetical protein
MVNPAYMMPLGCATYIMALSSSSYFSISSVAITLIFQVNFALTILFVYNPLLKVNTFWSEYLTISIMLSVAIHSYRYDHFRREIELFLLNKKINVERSFFQATLQNLPESIILIGKSSCEAADSVNSAISDQGPECSSDEAD